MKSKYQIVANMYANKKEIHKYFKEVKSFYKPGDILTSEHQLEVIELLSHHPKAIDKIGCGIKLMYVDYKDFGTVCYYLKRKDGTHESFSYIHCINKMKVNKLEKSYDR